MIKKALICSIISGIFFTTLASGLVLKFETKNLEEKGTIYTGIMYISGQKLPMRIKTGEHSGHMIFRGDKQLMWAVDDTKKECTELDKATMQQIGQTVNNAMQQFEAQMATMPPEQQEMMRKMMQEQMAQMSKGNQEALEFKNTGVTKKISGYPCTRYDAFRGTEKELELWVTKWVNLKNNKEVNTAFNSLSEFFKSFMDSMQNNPFMKGLENPYSYTEKINGFPILVKNLINGKAATETLFKSIEKKSVAASHFEPPEGYAINKADTKTQK